MLSKATKMTASCRKPAPALREQVKAARLGYLFPAAVIALWAALIPYLRDALTLNHAEVGRLVFCFGAGSIAGMLMASPLTKAIGSRLTCSLSALLSVIFILSIVLFPPFWAAQVLAFTFAAAAGCLEVAINIYGVSLERRYRLHLLTPLHAYYSAGELAGAALCLILLSLGVTPLCAVGAFCTLLSLTALRFFPSIADFDFKGDKQRSYMLPTFNVACLCLIVLCAYMVGGAMVDWSGIYLADNSPLTLKQAVLGYGLVSLCMMLCRIAGNALLRRLGALRLVLMGAAVMAAGLLLLALRPPLCLMILGFVLIGCGMANITPLSYSAAARQRQMPLLPAVSAMSISGYGGLLCGPALLGAVAYYLSLPAIFALLCLLVLASMLCMVKVRALYR